MKFSGMCVGPAVSSIVALVVMGMLAACHVTEQDGDVKGGAHGKNAVTQRTAKKHVETHCSELGIGIPTMVGNTLAETNYTYTHSRTTGYDKCEIPVTITASGARLMKERGVTCDYVMAGGMATGELELTLGPPEIGEITEGKGLYNVFNVYCDTKKILIESQGSGHDEQLVIRIKDDIPFYPQALLDVLLDVNVKDEDTKTALKKLANDDNTLGHYDDDLEDQLNNILGNNVQARKLMYITADYVEGNGYKHQAKGALEDVVERVKGGLNIETKREVGLNLVYGIGANDDFLGLTRTFYKKPYDDRGGQEPWFREEVEIEREQSTGEVTRTERTEKVW